MPWKVDHYQQAQLPKSLQGCLDVEGWLSEEVMCLFNALVPKAIDRTQVAQIVEIGAWQGRSTTLLAGILLQLASTSPLSLSFSEPLKLHSIDPFTGSSEHKLSQEFQSLVHRQYLKNLESSGLAHLVTTHIQQSKEALPEIDSPISFLFVDGSHAYADVLADFELGMEKLVSGGVMAFHDYKWPGVKRVIWEHVATHPHVGILFRAEDTVYFVKRSAASPAINACILLINKSLISKERLLHWLKRKKRKLLKLLHSIRPRQTPVPPL